MKIFAYGFKGQLDIAEKKITEFKDIVIETIQNKHTKQKDQRKNEWDNSNMWDNIKPYNIRVIEVLNQEMERKRQKKNT